MATRANNALKAKPEKPTVKLALDELKALIDELIEEKLEEMLGDPDRGLKVRPEVARRLKKSLAEARGGRRGIPSSEIEKNAASRELRQRVAAEGRAGFETD